MKLNLKTINIVLAVLLLATLLFISIGANANQLLNDVLGATLFNLLALLPIITLVIIGASPMIVVLIFAKKLRMAGYVLALLLIFLLSLLFYQIILNAVNRQSYKNQIMNRYQQKLQKQTPVL